MTNRQLVEAFLRVSRLEKNLSARTLKAYRSDLTGFFKFAGKRPLTKFDREDIREYLSRLELLKLKDATIRRKLATLKVFYGFLTDEGVISEAPTAKLNKKYRLRRLLPRVMSSVEITALLKAVYRRAALAAEKGGPVSFFAHRDRAILELLFATGMRIDELAGLSLSNIDLDQRTVLIFGKGRKERLLYISSEEVIEAVADYLEHRKRQGVETTALFLNRFGMRLGAGSVGQIFRRYCRAAGIERPVTAHCLRHTMATMLIENGADIRSVQEILGHSRISTTEIYLYVSRRRKEEVMMRFNGRNSLKIA